MNFNRNARDSVASYAIVGGPSGSPPFTLKENILSSDKVGA